MHASQIKFCLGLVMRSTGNVISVFQLYILDFVIPYYGRFESLVVVSKYGNGFSEYLCFLREGEQYMCSVI